MRFSAFLLCLLLAGCLLQAPAMHPPAPPPTEPAPPDPVLETVADSQGEDLFRQALESFRAKNNTQALQQAAAQYPDSLYALFTQDLLQLDDKLAKSKSVCSNAQQQRQRCLSEKEQQLLQLQQLQEKLERLTRSMLEQEKRTP